MFNADFSDETVADSSKKTSSGPSSFRAPDKHMFYRLFASRGTFSIIGVIWGLISMKCSKSVEKNLPLDRVK